MIESPWAVLLCKFSDDDDEPYPRSRYEEIFTSAGAGKWNMVDFFRDMSHGRLDVSGSTVFGWFTLDQQRSDYTGNGTNQDGRRELLAWARQKAADEGVPLDDYVSVVVVMNVNTDVFGGRGGVVTHDFRGNQDLSGLSPSTLGQEMCHFYGLGHSRAVGSDAGYGDLYDVMSTAAALMAAHPIYTDELDLHGQPRWRIGPGLNAANMSSRGWLDPSRLWDHNGRDVDTMVQLRPLHRRDLPGFLAVKLGGSFIEFRVDDGWDAGLYRPTVLLHHFEYDSSYLESNDAGQFEFGAGDTQGTDSPTLFGAMNRIQVEAIDADQLVATVRVTYKRGKPPMYFPDPDRPWRNPGIAWTELVGPDEALVVLDGQAIRVPRNSPVFGAVEDVARYEHAKMFGARAMETIRGEALAGLASRAQFSLESQRFRSPAPMNPPPTESNT